MDPIYDDRFVVFMRVCRDGAQRPDHTERVLATCASYEEARRICRAVHDSARQCTVRYVGPAGGGD